MDEQKLYKIFFEKNIKNDSTHRIGKVIYCIIDILASTTWLLSI